MGIPVMKTKHLRLADFETAGSVTREPEYIELPNPDPENFTLERVHQVGRYVCALVNYPDCTNFEGNKIIVFEDATVNELAKLDMLDPHFSEDGNILARLRPDETGWETAVQLAQMLDSQH